MLTSLVKTYKQVPMLEYCGIWVMMAITALSDLTYSVLVGLVMALVIFVYKYGKKGQLKQFLQGQSINLAWSETTETSCVFNT